jgi:hypothetical protein
LENKTVKVTFCLNSALVKTDVDPIAGVVVLLACGFKNWYKTVEVLARVNKPCGGSLGSNSWQQGWRWL